VIAKRGGAARHPDGARASTGAVLRTPATAIRGLALIVLIAAAAVMAPALTAPARAATEHHHPHHLTARQRHRAHVAHVAHLAHLEHLRRLRQERHRHGGRIILQSAPGNPQAIAAAMLGAYGWGNGQMGCLIPLWTRESGWNVYADNPNSGAYGIPQALPGDKMATAGADWQTDAATQIAWGLSYISGRYGSPCGAWGHEEADGWY
jgi:hypothetical protein